jgi:hypothetical protein
MLDVESCYSARRSGAKQCELQRLEGRVMISTLSDSNG